MIDDLRQGVAELLATAGLAGPFAMQPIAGGRNNRAYRVDAAGIVGCVKAYFHHPSDQRDRMGQEVGFATYAWAQGIRALPRPLAHDAERRLALAEWIDGRRLGPGEVTAAHVERALDFVTAANGPERFERARHLAAASEACFSLADHLACVDRRVLRLTGIDDGSPLSREAGGFAKKDVAATWTEVRRTVLARAAELGLSPGAALPFGARCLSPSDFGFHNALVVADGQMVFLDFEYAGWDDPAKMVCDFFFQVQVPVPRVHLPRFLARTAGLVADPDDLVRRVEILLPVFGMKWCCIFMNEFLPVGAARRGFSDGTLARPAHRANQLALAREWLSRREEWTTHGIC